MARHTIAPVSLGTFTATSFTLRVNVDSDNPVQLCDVVVVFYDSAGNPGRLPATASPAAVIAAVASFAAGTAQLGETPQQLVKRLASSFAQSVFGVSVLT